MQNIVGDVALICQMKQVFHAESSISLPRKVSWILKYTHADQATYS